MGERVDEVALPVEQRARVLIDRQLTDAGWLVQDTRDLTLTPGQGVARREVVMKPGHGRADYLLYIDRRAVGVIEAKPQGTTLSGVEWQSAMYAEGLPDAIARRAVTIDGRLPFVVEANGSETHFTNGFDPDARARRLVCIPRPESLAMIIRKRRDRARPSPLACQGAVRDLPAVKSCALRSAQIAAIRGMEHILDEQRQDRSLAQTATGGGRAPAAHRSMPPGGVGRRRQALCRLAPPTCLPVPVASDSKHRFAEARLHVMPSRDHRSPNRVDHSADDPATTSVARRRRQEDR